MLYASVEKPAPAAAVVYVDHANHLTPLTLAYHATASRHITSGRTDVVPPSTMVEVESAYCPRCLTYRDAASVSSGVCQVDLDNENSYSGASCKDCPICFSPLAISIDAAEKSLDGGVAHFVCHYLCGHCQWSSQECGVISTAANLLHPNDGSGTCSDADLEKQRLKAISEMSRQLELSLQQTIEHKNRCAEVIFQSLTNMWSQREKDGDRLRRLGLGIEFLSSSNETKKDESWSLESLEQRLLETKNALTSSFTNVDAAVESLQSDELMAIDRSGLVNPDTSEKDNAITPTPEQTSAQMSVTTTSPRLRSDLLPLPVPFRARLGRRCVAELANGKTGILMKPKPNPLEGDSSLRAGHGQWYKKDSSAVHVVPRVQVFKHGADTSFERFAVLLKVKNPTLSMIRLRLTGASWTTGNDNTCNNTNPINDRELKHIPIDPFNDTFVDACFCPPPSPPPTEWLELESASDLFLDMGKVEAEDPTEVRDWEPLPTLLQCNDDDHVSRFHVVATNKDTAWVELVLRIESNTSHNILTSRPHWAVPIGMQIEVGNGSWEASFIKRRDVPPDQIDSVTLNLVVLLNH